MNCDLLILEELKEIRASLKRIEFGMKKWKDADVEAHYKRDKALNQKLVHVLDILVKKAEVVRVCGHKKHHRKKR